jgi:hypothetical protein
LNKKKFISNNKRNNDMKKNIKKIFYWIPLSILTVVFSSAALADGWDGGYGHHGWGHHHHHGHHGWGGGGRQVNNYYYPQPQGNYYYQQPPVIYYPPQPPQYYNGGGQYDNRSHQGLAGGVIGTVFGYELGNGNPLAAGIGAAAGSYLGNGVGWRY